MINAYKNIREAYTPPLYFLSICLSFSYAYSSPNLAIELRKKLQEKPAHWMKKQIATDLKHYQQGITKADIDSTAATLICYARCKVTNQGISVESNAGHPISLTRLRLLKNILQKLHDMVKLPKLDFLVDLHDACACTVKKAPVFCISKHANDTHVILMPDFVKFTSAPGNIRDAYKGSKRYPWHAKKAQAFWRGTTTGAMIDHTDFERLNRFHLVALSLKRPKDLNARFTGVAQNDSLLEKILKQKGMLDNHLSVSEHLRYRYLLAIDGNTWASSYFWQLFGNSLILKQASFFSEWYHAALKPYMHYVPLKRDFSDLIDRIAWAKKHENRARTIVKHAHNFARAYLKEVDLYYYFYLSLKEYARLQYT